MRKVIVTVCLVSFLAWACIAQAHHEPSTVIVEHVGSLNPQTDEGWGGFGAQTGSTDAGPPENWHLMQAGAGSSGNSIANFDPGLVQSTDGWTGTVTAKVNRSEGYINSAITFNDASSSIWFGFFSANAPGGAAVYFYHPDGDTVDCPGFFNQAPCSQIGTVDPSDGFHTYHLVMDPVDNTNSADDVLTVWVDGVKEQTWDRSELFPATNTRVWWGRGTAGSVGSDTQWAHVRMETGQHPSGPSVIIAPTEVAWRDDVAGDWNTPGNWDPSTVPDATNITAIFGDAIQEPRTVFTDAHVTVKGMQFLNLNTYGVSGAGSINLNSGTSAPKATIEAFLGDHEFQARVNLEVDTDVTIASNSSLAFSNTLNLGGHTLTKTGDGTLVIRNTLTTGGGTLNIQQGTVSGNGAVGGDVNNNGGTISPGDSFTVGAAQAVVPEPGAMPLLLIGMLAYSCLVLRTSPERARASS